MLQPHGVECILVHSSQRDHILTSPRCTSLSTVIRWREILTQNVEKRWSGIMRVCANLRTEQVQTTLSGGGVWIHEEHLRSLLSGFDAVTKEKGATLVSRLWLIRSLESCLCFPSLESNIPDPFSHLCISTCDWTATAHRTNLRIILILFQGDHFFHYYWGFRSLHNEVQIHHCR